jgi:thioredoxin-related protein
MGALRVIVYVAAFMSIAAGPVQADSHMPTLPVPQVSDDGMYAQEWYYDSHLDLRKDLAAAGKAGKRLVVLWEKKECGNCKSMHEVNLRIPRVVEKIRKGFNVVRLDIWGDRKVTDLDGSVLAEKKLAEKNKITFTPTFQFLPESLDKAAGRSGKDAEDFRIEGYFKPFHFYFLFNYVQTRGYESQPNFQRWLGPIGRGLAEKNIHYDLWADSLPAKLPDVY